MKIKLSDVSSIKMSVNPPKEVIDAGYCVIHNKEVKHWVGIGWVTERSATPEDFKNIPEAIE